MAKTETLRSRVETRKRLPLTIRNYQSAINFLNSATNYEKLTRIGYNPVNFSLARMNRLLAALGNPHKQFKSVHIAGTKGKGSTATMLACMLTNSGLRTGLYTSPHMIDVRERIQLNGEMIPEPEMTRLSAKIAGVMRKLGNDSPTFFEILTAMSFLYYAEQEVDVAVIETGLGGRLDSTNVLKPEVCGITSISFDHMAQLGNTLEKIATEKAGIIKPGVPVVSAHVPVAGFGRVHKECRGAGAGQGRGDLAADVTGLAHAHHYHASLAGKDQLAGEHEAFVDAAAKLFDGFGFQLDGALRGVDQLAALAHRGRGRSIKRARL